MRIGRIGPHSRQAHFLRVFGLRFITGAASAVGRNSGNTPPVAVAWFIVVTFAVVRVVSDDYQGMHDADFLR